MLPVHSCFFNVCKKKLPDGGSDEPKHVAQCCITLKCCVWWFTWYFSDKKRTLAGIAQSLVIGYRLVVLNEKDIPCTSKYRDLSSGTQSLLLRVPAVLRGRCRGRLCESRIEFKHHLSYNSISP
jgi:hypothetical protein